MRSNKLSKLEINQITRCVIEGIKMFMIKHEMEAIDGTSKNAWRGIKMIQNTPSETPIFDENNIDGIVNV